MICSSSQSSTPSRCLESVLFQQIGKKNKWPIKHGNMFRRYFLTKSASIIETLITKWVPIQRVADARPRAAHWGCMQPWYLISKIMEIKPWDKMSILENSYLLLLFKMNTVMTRRVFVRATLSWLMSLKFRKVIWDLGLIWVLMNNKSRRKTVIILKINNQPPNKMNSFLGLERFK